ncbi:MAG: hypothetical protein ACRYF8_12340 [Janthinobacterium lividum]
MVAFTDSHGNILISASDVAAHVEKLKGGGFIRSYGPNPDIQLANSYYSLYSDHLDQEGGGNFCDCIIINSPQGDGVIIFPIGVPGSGTLAEQDIKAWNAAASKAADLPELFNYSL